MDHQWPEPKYFRDVVVCERLGVSRPTLWKWVEEGRFPPPRDLGSRAKRWHVGDTARWEESPVNRKR
ncbi:MAG: AlpA family phage regulatory protein [bacterium]|nr:AlpA family phage regulatory protein [bacterium]MDE0216535.1 AlpA family phage regulatory protein [bacterium]